MYLSLILDHTKNTNREIHTVNVDFDKDYLLFNDFSSEIVDKVEGFSFSKMESVSKNYVEAKTCEHAEDGKHGDALAESLSFVKDCVSLE